ncbi:Rv3212 family protein [Nocardia carnea]|uniref:PQQ-binding-like beta-propeller repeat protein n=1 Tax=Nocardia carnea TaxID=37328 RepID=A0ABW7TTE7_9NOCA|nr:PQQ-binding-like beta-propeller repeat protein [Nocardia carnea]
MLAPERRTRADVITAAAIAVVVVIAGIVAWVSSDVAGTESVVADKPARTPSAARDLPDELRELWRAPDTATDRALTSEGVAVTADGGTVTGHDRRTGEQVWRYTRDLPLCGVEAQFGMVIAVYRSERGCSETTMLSGADGRRRTARSSYMDDQVRLSVDGTYVVAHGPRRLEMWRSDLVRTLEYGYVDAKENWKTQPRHDCELQSAASSSSRLVVLERCPGDPAGRLTVLAPAPKDDNVPEEYGSRILEGPGADSPDARVIAVSDNRIAVYQPGTSGPEVAAPRLTIFDAKGNPLVVQELSAPLDETTTTVRSGSAFLVFTGNSVIALQASTFDPMWTAADALGAPVLMADRLLIPVPGAIAALDPADGTEIARIPVDRPDYRGGPISLGVLGNTILEHRDGVLVALADPDAPDTGEAEANRPAKPLR